MKRKLRKLILAAVSGLILFQTGFFFSPQTKLEAEARSGQVTEYFNEEEGEKRTIYWASGITPPKMGGADSDFKKEITNVNNIQYIEYKAPYVPGRGWYDVNKTEDRVPDANLCFAAAAANGLHWWMAQNSQYIDRYLEKNPDLPKADKIKNLKQPFNSQYDSPIYQIFVSQFANRKEGYWPDILQDQFINGYYPKEHGGVNDPDFDGDNLISKGPDPRGGFFYEAFGRKNLTARHYYETGYYAFGNDLKNYLQSGNFVTMTYDMGASAHVVSLWGAEYDAAGRITGVYFSDSDDDKKYGMQRYRVINKNGRAYVTTNNAGTGSRVSCITVLFPGEAQWKKVLENEKTELELIWGKTQFVYTGSVQQPEVTAKNIATDDDVKLSVKGGAVAAGTYTAQAVLEGSDADKYILPKNSSTLFTILRSATSFDGTVRIYNGVQETNHFMYGDTVTVKVKPKATGTAAFSKQLTSNPDDQIASLYAGDQRLSDEVRKGADGVFIMTYDTGDGKLGPGVNTLTVKFKGDANMADYSEDIQIIIEKQSENVFIPVEEIPASCEKDGVKAHFTDQAGRLYLESEGVKIEVTSEALRIPALGHDWEKSYTVDQAAGCTTDGIQSRHCSRCDKKTDSRPIPAAHRTGEWIAEIPATDTQNGVAGHYVCQVCRKNLAADKKTEITNLVLKPQNNNSQGNSAQNGNSQGNGSQGGNSQGNGAQNSKPQGNKPQHSVKRMRIRAVSGRIAAGKKIQLHVETIPANAHLPKLVWSSSNPKLAAVDQNGAVSLKKKAGGKKVVITAAATDGSGIRASCTIKVMKGSVKKITISGKRPVKAGKSLKLTAKVKASKGANRKLEWSSSNKAFAEVTPSGVVKTKKAGKGKKVRITASATDGSNKKASVTIRIK
ncbi:MAG: IdeS/Mac family cysteine endopeptidase [Lachnospiraceae bacterium]|nr:IdeS/Mac family cysteine endopeptidase [Lachnospiraceae bacterium]